VATHRPFRFGVFAHQAATREAWRDTVREAEELGYDTLQVGDHLQGALGPISALVSAADASSSIRLGSCVFGNDFRHPVMLAQEAASIDVLSGGRLELGLGAGYLNSDYAQLGMPLDSPGTRVSRLEEAVKVLKGVLSNSGFTFTGRYYQVRNVTGVRTPVQRPHPPLMLGGGARWTLSLAAREADIVSVNIKTTPEGSFDIPSITAAGTAQKLAWVREAAGARVPLPELHHLVLGFGITEQPEEAAAAFMRLWGMENAITPQALCASPHALFGTVDEIVDLLEMRRETYGFSYLTVFEHALRDFAPVVQRLRGT
jgi:probable F420-dependent oxidoreductase